LGDFEKYNLQKPTTERGAACGRPPLVFLFPKPRNYFPAGGGM
jgi:hypothetical protein